MTDLTKFSASNWIENLISECIAYDPEASKGEYPTMYWATLKEYPSIKALNNLDKKLKNELTFAAIEKLKKLLINNADIDKIKTEKRDFFGDDSDKYYEWFDEWQANIENFIQHESTKMLVEDCLDRLINHLIRWHYDFNSEAEFITMLTSFEFEIYDSYDKKNENNYWKFPVSLVLGKLNVFASFNTISNEFKTFLASYPTNKNFNIPLEDWTLESAEVFFEAIQDKRVARSTNAVFYDQAKKISDDVKTFLNNLIEDSLLVGNPSNYDDFCKITDFSTFKLLAKKSEDFKIELADLVFEQMIFFAENQEAWTPPYNRKYNYVNTNVLDKLFTTLLKTHISLITETDIVAYFQKFYIEIDLQERTIHGYKIFSNQIDILIKTLTKFVETNGMSSQLSNFLRDVVNKHIKLKGVLEIKIPPPKTVNYEKQVAETGKINVELQIDPQKNIIDWCSINNDLKLLQGNLYNIGFFPKEIIPEEQNLDYNTLAKDMDFLQECKAILDDAGCTNWRFNDTTGVYYPFICRKSMQTDDEIVNALGIIESAQIEPFTHHDEESNVPKIISVDFFDDEETCIEEELENDEEADVSEAQLHLKAYNKVNKLLHKNIDGTINEFAILAGYDYYPIFKIGKSKVSGNYIGFISVVCNRYIYS